MARNPNLDIVIEYLKGLFGPSTPKEIASANDLSIDATRRALRAGVKEGCIHKTKLASGKTEYELAEVKIEVVVGASSEPGDEDLPTVEIQVADPTPQVVGPTPQVVGPAAPIIDADYKAVEKHMIENHPGLMEAAGYAWKRVRKGRNCFDWHQHGKRLAKDDPKRAVLS